MDRMTRCGGTYGSYQGWQGNQGSREITITGVKITRINFPREGRDKARVINQSINMLRRYEIELPVAVALLFQIGKSRGPFKVLEQTVVNRIIKSIKSDRRFFHAKNIGNVCYELRGLDGRAESTKRLVSALALKIEQNESI